MTASAPEVLFYGTVAIGVLHFELKKRMIEGSEISAWRPSDCKRLIRECAPEIIGFLACVCLAAALRSRGDVHDTDGEDNEAWEEIKAQWPLLLTADTLLAVQAMLRVVVLASVACRSPHCGPVPSTDEASALWLGAAVARVLLCWTSSVYMLDGPVGGLVPVACEVIVVPILLRLSWKTLQRAPLTLGAAFALTAWFAYRNHLSLAGDIVADGLFLAAHCLDILSAFAFLARTVLISHSDQDVCIGFAHLLMPLQQALPAYYFLQAFDYGPELVGAGSPFQVLQYGNVAAWGAYLAASALFFAEVCFRSPSAATAAPVAVGH